MKNLFALIAVLSTYGISGKTHPSKVKEVIVYQTRAEVKRIASLQLAAGEQELVFSGISTLADPNNIQIKGTGNLIILGTSFRKNFLNENELPSDLQKIKNQMSSLDREIRKLLNANAALEAEKTMLESNQRIGGNQENLSLEDLKSISTYYRSRINSIADEQLSLQEKIQEKREEVKKLNAHYADRTSQFKKNSGEIVVTVDAKSATKSNLEIVYMVSSVGWKAEYEVRAQDVDSPLQFGYKAIITQNTGENWEDVKLTISTGNPNASIIKPELPVQYVNFWTNYKKYKSDYRNRLEATGAVSRAVAPISDEEYFEEPPIEQMEVASETKTMYTNYVIERAYSLASGGKPLNVTIRDQQVDADYEYQAVPKLRNRVFLVAKAKNWGELVLLPGPINIFFEGGYVGKSFMNPQITADNLPISLGYDPGITIERKKLVEKSSKRTIGANQKETFAYEISIRNNKRKNITVVVEDQVPVSKNSEIKVENVVTDGSDYNSTTGVIKWTLNISSAQQIKKQLSFDVRYPKGKTISGL